MRLKDLRERVKGGKLDPLSKMGKSKLTGQEIATYYRKNPNRKPQETQWSRRRLNLHWTWW